MNEPTSTPRLDAIVMTPAIASVLYGWASPGEDGLCSVIGSVIASILDEQVNCEISGDEWERISLTLFSEKNIGRADEIVAFLMAMTHCDGAMAFQSVMINIRCFRHVER